MAGATVVSPRLGKDGWPFASIDSFPAADEDPLFHAEHIKDIYLRVDPEYGGRFTVPVLFDKKNNAIVNNESLWQQGVSSLIFGWEMKIGAGRIRDRRRGSRLVPPAIT